MKSLPVVALTALCFSCSPPPAPGPKFIGNNNWAILDGGTFGEGKTALFALQKPVIVKATGAEGTLSVLDGFLFRDHDSSETAYFVIRVKNIGEQGLCFIKAANLKWKNPVGAVLITDAFTYVHGSIGQFNSAGTATCLAAGERGALAGIHVSQGASTSYFSPVSEVELSWELSSLTGMIDPKSKMIPTAYTVASASTVRISYSNSGTTGATITRSGTHFMVGLNSSSAPNFWTFASDDFGRDGGVVAASAAGGALGYVFSDISASSMWVFVEFEDCASCLVAQPTGSHEEVQQARLAAWNDRQRQKQRLLEGR